MTTPDPEDRAPATAQDRFAFPLVDPDDPGRPPSPVVSGRRYLLRRAMGRVAGRRRLAVVDTHFPWRLSGFRFHEFSEIRRQRPDTVFFSLFEMSEEFESPVYALADFPRLAPALGVTDVYFVFLNFAVGLLGLAGDDAAAACPGVRPDISVRPTLRRFDIRSHVTLYPGGGLLPHTPPALLTKVAAAVDTVFTNAAEVENAVPGALLSPVVTDVEFYTPAAAADSPGPHRLVFAADDRPRKGLLTLIGALNLLPDDFHLDIVGPHRRHLGELREGTNWTYHGWLTPERLREVYRRAGVFVSPVSTDRPDEPDGEPGMVDGFPTTCARDAMATGCCLVSANPRGERRVFRPGVDYIEIPERDPEALAKVLLDLRDDPALYRRIAPSGSARVRERVSVRATVETKLQAMGLR